MGISLWSDNQIEAAIAVLRGHRRVVDALPEIAGAVGRSVTTDSLKHAFKARKLGAPSDWLAGRVTDRAQLSKSPSGGVYDSAKEAGDSRESSTDYGKVNGDEPDILRQLIEITRKRALPLLDVCDKLDASPGAVRECIAWAQDNGYHVRQEAGHVFTRLGVGPTGLVEIGSTTPGRKRVAIVTDIHFGSRYCDDRGLRAFLSRATNMGCEAVVCTGDILDGHSPKLTFEQRAVGFDGQESEALSAFEGLEIPVVAIAGNHDGYHSSLNGIDAGRVLAEHMQSQGVRWHHLGACLGEAVVCGARWQLWHPHGGASTRNAVRRVLNTRAECEAQRGHRIDVLACGHFHKHVSFTAYPERTFCVAGGCYQTKGSEFSNRIANDWDVGGTVVSYTVRDDGSVGEFAAEFYEVAA